MAMDWQFKLPRIVFDALFRFAGSLHLGVKSKFELKLGLGKLTKQIIQIYELFVYGNRFFLLCHSSLSFHFFSFTGVERFEELLNAFNV